MTREMRLRQEGPEYFDTGLCDGNCDGEVGPNGISITSSRVRDDGARVVETEMLVLCEQCAGELRDFLNEALGG